MKHMERAWRANLRRRTPRYWTKLGLPVVDYVHHNRNPQPVPIKRSVLIDRNKYNPRDCGRRGDGV